MLRAAASVAACHAEDGSGAGKRIVPVIAGMPAVHPTTAVTESIVCGNFEAVAHCGTPNQ
ncbi:MAG: hypothetical protein KC572_09610 [Gammaproteobacteria bacterium]|nr:hypothetical protein [Gammaproteobacteria bacterium]